MWIARTPGCDDMLDPLASEVLDALRFPGAEDDLAERLSRFEWEGESLREIPAIMAELREAGLAVEPQELVGEALAEEPNGAPALPGIDVLAWITADRPDLLSRALAAWGARLEADQEGFPEIVIADDSRHQAAETRAVVESFARQYPGRTRLLDHEFRVQLAEKLEADLPPEVSSSARFALGFSGSPTTAAPRYGVNRNTLLLACAGRTAVMVDDDILPEFRVRPDATEAFILNCDPRAWGLEAFTSRESLEAFGTPVAGPVLGPHRRLLGASGRNLDATAACTDLTRADAVLIRRFFGPGPAIRALSFGYWGDSGTSTTRYLLTSRHVMQRQEMSSAEYQAMSASRCAFRAPRCVTVGNGGMMGLHLALDLREPLPPFFPYGRNEDALWLYLFARLHAEQLVGYPTEAVHHYSAPRTGSPEQDAAGWDVCLNDQMRLILEFCRLEGGEDMSSYGAAGDVFARVSGLPEEEVSGLAGRLVGEYLGMQVGILNAAYDHYEGQPEAWGQTIKTLHRNLQAQRRALQEAAPAAAEAGAVRGYAGDLGRLLAAWPLLHQRAVALAAEWQNGASPAG
jgi:hypothetical protein